MLRLLLSSLALLGTPLLLQAAWIVPSSLSVTVEGYAGSSSGENTFSETDSLESAFGTRSVSGEAESCVEVAPGFIECSTSSASAMATVAGNAISFASHVEPQFVEFDANATSSAEVAFEVAQQTSARFELNVGGSKSWFNATISDENGNNVFLIWATNTFWLGEPTLGNVMWHGEYPFGVDLFTLDQLLERDWPLAAGHYTLTTSTQQERLAGSVSYGDYEFRMVPEPVTTNLRWLLGLAIAYLARRRRVPSTLVLSSHRLP